MTLARHLLQIFLVLIFTAFGSVQVFALPSDWQQVQYPTYKQELGLCGEGDRRSEEDIKEARDQLTRQAGYQMDGFLAEGMKDNEQARAFFEANAPSGVIAGTEGNGRYVSHNQTWFSASGVQYEAHIINAEHLPDYGDIYSAFDFPKVFDTKQNPMADGATGVLLSNLPAWSEEYGSYLSPSERIGLASAAIDAAVSAKWDLASGGTAGAISPINGLLVFTEGELSSLSDKELTALGSATSEAILALGAYMAANGGGGSSVALRNTLARLRAQQEQMNNAAGGKKPVVDTNKPPVDEVTGQQQSNKIPEGTNNLLPPHIKDLSEKNINNSGKTVLGSYPQYLDKAKAKGASYFDIGDSWESLSDAQRWAANRNFLDKISDKGDDVLMAIKKSDIIPNTWTAREIEYLTKPISEGGKGYKWVNQWSLKKP